MTNQIVDPKVTTLSLSLVEAGVADLILES